MVTEVDVQVREAWRALGRLHPEMTTLGHVINKVWGLKIKRES